MIIEGIVLYCFGKKALKSMRNKQQNQVPVVPETTYERKEFNDFKKAIAYVLLTVDDPDELKDIFVSYKDDWGDEYAVNFNDVMKQKRMYEKQNLGLSNSQEVEKLKAQGLSNETIQGMQFQESLTSLIDNMIAKPLSSVIDKYQQKQAAYQREKEKMYM